MGVSRAPIASTSSTAWRSIESSAIERDLGAVSLLTNNAAAFSAYGPIWTVDAEEWRRGVETNIFGTLNCCRAALPTMIARGRPDLVMTAGGTATSFPVGSGYATSKAGLLRLAECVGDTHTGFGLLAFAMDPGSCRPP
jgi:NAD(P)-dependent dehydrogenase (short-subunit alcohol dehydrogenase family)